MVTLFRKKFVIMIGISFLIAGPYCYYLMDQWLSGFAYHIDISIWLFAVGVLLTWLITILTISSQIVRAATANPVEALRSE
jgi:putative ABC transport system permease protein